MELKNTIQPELVKLTRRTLIDIVEPNLIEITRRKLWKEMKVVFHRDISILTIGEWKKFKKDIFKAKNGELMILDCESPFSFIIKNDMGVARRILRRQQVKAGEGKKKFFPFIENEFEKGHIKIYKVVK